MMGWKWRQPPREIHILTKLEIPTGNSALGTVHNYKDTIPNQELSFYAMDCTFFMETVNFWVIVENLTIYPQTCSM